MQALTKLLIILIFAPALILLSACTQTKITSSEKAMSSNECLSTSAKASELNFQCDDILVKVSVDAEKSSTPGMFDKDNGQWVLALSFNSTSAINGEVEFDFADATLSREDSDHEAPTASEKSLQKEDSVLKATITGAAPIFVSGVKVVTPDRTYELSTIEVKLDYHELALGKLVLEVLTHSVIILGS